MATIATRGAVHHDGRNELGPARALQIAWWTWLVLLLAPFIFFLCVAYRLNGDTVVADKDLSHAWFLGTMAYLCVATPAAVFWRSYLFKPYWNGDVVTPRNYLVGMTSVWLALEIGGLAALLGGLLSHTYVPCTIPGIAAFVFFLPFWPSGEAMVRRNVGNTDDPGRYKEPR